MMLKRRRESWDPMQELEELSNRVNRLFGLTRWGDGEGEAMSITEWSPPCDITETEDEYRVHIELPNVKREDVHVTFRDGVLTIRGERREEKEEKGVRIHRRELSYGNFMRRFTMPNDADPSTVDATYKDGVLNIVIGKTTGKATKTSEIAVH